MFDVVGVEVSQRVGCGQLVSHSSRPVPSAASEVPSRAPEKPVKRPVGRTVFVTALKKLRGQLRITNRDGIASVNQSYGVIVLNQGTHAGVWQSSAVGLLGAFNGLNCARVA